MPYSVSVPMTRRTLMLQSLVPTYRHRAQGAGRTYLPRPAAGYRYCPVLATVSMDRPASVPCLPETRVLM